MMDNNMDDVKADESGEIESESAGESWRSELVSSLIKWLPVWLPTGLLYVFFGLLGYLPFPQIPDILTVTLLCAVGVIIVFGAPYGFWIIYRTESLADNIVYAVDDSAEPDECPIRTYKGGDALASDLSVSEGSVESYLDGRTAIRVAREFVPEASEMVGTWRGAVSPREVLASAENIKRYREQIEPLAEYGFDRKINEVHDAKEYERSYHLRLAKRDLEDSALAPDVFDDDRLARLLGHIQAEDTSVDDGESVGASDTSSEVESPEASAVASDGVAVTDGGEL